MKINLFIILMLSPLFLFPQKRKEKATSEVIQQSNRIEFEKHSPASEFHIVPGHKDGLLVVEETNKFAGGGGYEWKIHLIDSTFRIVWTRLHVVPAEGTLIGHQYFDGKFYLLFKNNPYKGQELSVYRFGINADDFESFEITTVFPLELKHFESVGETLLLAGYANFRPVVIAYQLKDRIPKVLPGFYDNKSEILDVVVDEKSRLFTVIMSEKMRNKRYTVRVKTFNAWGDIIQDNLVNPGEKKSLINGASTSFSGGLQYLAGTHSKKSLQYSQGFYLSKFINGQQQFNKYYPFAELDNFWDHLNPKREERIKRKIEKRKEKGKVKKFSYRLLVHQILERDDEYILIGEAYYPRYNYATSGTGFTGFGTFGRFPTSQLNSPYFLGYKYTHAVVVGFDRNCSIIWDHTFKIDDIQTYLLEENVAVSSYGDKVVLMYLEENEIRSKVVKGNEVVEGHTFNPVKLSFANDQLLTKDPPVEKVKRWYDNVLFAYGEQSIANSVVDGNGDRKVFYINKIEYDPDVQPK